MPKRRGCVTAVLKSSMPRQDVLALGKLIADEAGWEKVTHSKKFKKLRQARNVASEFEAKSKEINKKLNEPFSVRVTVFFVTRSRPGERINVMSQQVQVVLPSSIFTAREWFGDFLASAAAEQTFDASLLASCLKSHSRYRALLEFEVIDGVLAGRSFCRPFVWSRSGQPCNILPEQCNPLASYGITSFSNMIYFDTLELFDKSVSSVIRFGPYGRLPRELCAPDVILASLGAVASAYTDTLPVIKKLKSKVVDAEAAALRDLAARSSNSVRAGVAQYTRDAVHDPTKAFITGLAHEPIPVSNFFSLLSALSETTDFSPSHSQPVAPKLSRHNNRDAALRRIRRKIKEASEPAIAYVLGNHGPKRLAKPVREALQAKYLKTLPSSKVVSLYAKNSFMPLSEAQMFSFAKQDNAIPVVFLSRINRRFFAQRAEEDTVPPGARVVVDDV